MEDPPSFSDKTLVDISFLYVGRLLSVRCFSPVPGSSDRPLMRSVRISVSCHCKVAVRKEKDAAAVTK